MLQKQNSRLLSNILRANVLQRTININPQTSLSTHYTNTINDREDNVAIDLNNTSTDTTILTQIDQQIQYALQLDQQRRPRLSRSGNTEILIHQKKQATENERMMVLFTAKRWEWNDPQLLTQERQRIARAACNQVAYDYGYETELAYTQLSVWETLINEEIRRGKEKCEASEFPLKKL